MMRPLHWLMALGLLIAPMPATAQADQSSPFSDSERTALHAEIRAYLLAHPEVLMEMMQLLEEQQKTATVEADRRMVSENAGDIFDDGFSYVGGNPDGAVTVVEFLDYQCGFCRRAHPELAQLLSDDGDIRWIVKEMPILGPGSELAARAAVATLITEGPDRYLALHNRLMELKGEVTDTILDHALAEVGLDPAAIRASMNDPEVDRRLGATRALAEKLAIAGTPTFVLDDRMLRGYLPREQMQQVVNEARAAN
jgi:protein-disulfide isomerase